MSHLVIRGMLMGVVLGSASLPAQPPALTVKAHIDLTLPTDGFAGRIELLEDARITPELDKTLRQSGGPDMALDENDPLAKQLAVTPLHAAALRLVDASGKTVAQQELRREQGRLEVHQLHPGHRSIFVTTDLSAGFGSYSGPLTQILDVSHGALDYVQARDVYRNSSEPLSLASTGKTGWRLVAAPASSGPARDILQIACRPDLDHPKSSKFLLTYTRFHWTGSEWVSAEAQRSGFWESDQPFPSFAFFPDIPTEAY